MQNPTKAFDKTEETSSLVELIEILKTIDDNSPEAKLNETTISDNNGGRIII